MKTCLFCSTPLTSVNRSKEHAIPKWLLTVLDYAPGCFVCGTSTYPNEPLVVFDETERSSLSLVLGNVCTTCNTGWMAQLEEDTKPLMESLCKGFGGTLFTRDHCSTLAHWTFKTAATLNYSANYKKVIPLHQIQQFYSARRLPETATVDVAFCREAGINWIIGGNKILVAQQLDEEQLRAAYVISLHFAHVLLRIAWSPTDQIKAAAFSRIHQRIFPEKAAALVIKPLRLFRDLPQFHFMFTAFAEEGALPSAVGI